MDIFKLFFNHDLRLDQLAGDQKENEEGTLEDFMTPTLTYSRFYLTGTQIRDSKLGLSTLRSSSSIIQKLEEALSESFQFPDQNNQSISLEERIHKADPGNAILGWPTDSEKPPIKENTLSKINRELRDIRKDVRIALRSDAVILYKEPERDGFDLQIMCMENFYKSLFHAFKPLLSDEFRFFSINSKRIGSRKKYYFEQFSLERLPHGAEEVKPQTVL